MSLSGAFVISNNLTGNNQIICFLVVALLLAILLAFVSFFFAIVPYNSPILKFLIKTKRADTRQPSYILHLTSYIPKVIPPAPRQSYRRPGCHPGCRHPR